MLIGSLFVLCVLWLMIRAGKYYKNAAQKNVKIYRRVNKERLRIGEDFYMDLVIENRQRKVAPLIHVMQAIPNKIFLEEAKADDFEHTDHTIQCSLLGGKRLIDRLHFKAMHRGTYVLKNMVTGFGDFFGFFYEEEAGADFREVVILPEYHPLKSYSIKETDNLGEIFTSRWMNPDPMFIKSMRDYQYGDSFRDIHWKQSARHGKLISKVYDYTEETSWMLLLNLQCGKEHLDQISLKKIEQTISLCGAIAEDLNQKGLPVGYGTNARLISVSGYLSSFLPPVSSNLEAILEYLARTDYYLKDRFDEFLRAHMDDFHGNTHYVILSLYQSEQTEALLSQMAQRGLHITLIQCFNQTTASSSFPVYTYGWEDIRDEI